MYKVVFQRKAGGAVLKIRLDSWAALVRWLGEHPGMYRLRVEVEGA